MLNLTKNKVLQSSLENCFVNGLQNEELARTILQKRIYKHQQTGLKKVNGKGFSYIKIELNNFIGNPE